MGAQPRTLALVPTPWSHTQGPGPGGGAGTLPVVSAVGHRSPHNNNVAADAVWACLCEAAGGGRPSPGLGKAEASRKH